MWGVGRAFLIVTQSLWDFFLYLTVTVKTQTADTGTKGGVKYNEVPHSETSDVTLIWYAMCLNHGDQRMA